MSNQGVYASIRRMLGNPTETELPDEDLIAYFNQALVEYSYAIRKYDTITVTEDEAYDVSSYTNLLDIIGVFKSSTGESLDFTFNAATDELTVSDYSGDVDIIYVITYDYDDIPVVDRPYVKYLTAAFCLEQIAAIRDRVPIVSSFKLVSGDDIRNEGQRYLDKWNSRFALSEVY